MYQLRSNVSEGVLTMLRLAIVFLVFALVAGLFGFGIIAETSWVGAKIFFYVFLVLAVLTFLSRTLSRETA